MSDFAMPLYSLFFGNQGDQHPAANENAPAAPLYDSEAGAHEQAAHDGPQPSAATVDAMKLAHMFGIPLGTTEVDGVPATAVAREDDEDGLFSQSVTEKKWGLGSDGLERRATTTTTEGGHKDVDVSSTKVGINTENKSVTLGNTQSHEHEYSERVSSKDSSGTSVEVGLNGVKLGVSDDKEKKVGEHVSSHGSNASAGVDADGKVSVTVGKKDKQEDAHGAVETGSNVSVGEKGVKWDSDRTVEKKEMVGGEEKKSSTTTGVGASIGPDSVGVDAKYGRKNADGSGSSTSGGIEIEDGNIKANVGQKWTDARGNSASLSLSAGQDFVCGDPVQVGNKWQVSYKRSDTIGAGAGGSSHGMGVSGGGSHASFDEGTRTFDSKDEAERFKKNAKEETENQAAPTTLLGALTIPIGESRGAGTTDGLNVGGSVAVEGASFGGDKSKAKTSQVDVRRLSGSVVEVTWFEQTGDNGGLHAGGMGVTTGAGKSSGEHSGLTYRFDLATPDGATAFQKFCDDHQAPEKGGQYVSKEHGLDEGTTDGTKVIGLGSGDWHYDASENTVTDAKGGVHQTFTGEKKYDLDPSRIARWTGDKERHEKVDLTSKVDNGRLTGASIEGHFGGADGSFNAEEMKKLVGSHEKLNDDAKASGDWTVSADIQLDLMKDYHIGHQGTESQKARTLAHHFADMKDESYRIAPFIEGYGERDPKLKHEKLDWNVELKGDANFPGKAGRELNAAKLAMYKSALDADVSASAQTAESLEQEIAQLRERRNAVDPATNPKQYTDLPPSLRQGELGHIDADLAELEALRHRATIEAIKNTPGESAASIDKRQKDSRHDQNKSPEERQLADLRDQLAQFDALIAEADGESEYNLTVLADTNAGLGTELAKDPQHYSKALETKYRTSMQAGQLEYKMHHDIYFALDEQRMLFLKMIDNPTLAFALGQSLLSQVRAQLPMAIEARDKLAEAYDAVNEMTGDDDAADDTRFANGRAVEEDE